MRIGRIGLQGVALRALANRSVASVLAVALHAGLARAEPGLAPSTSEVAACSLQPGPVRTVTRIIDGETVALDDGSEVRLIGALAPRARDTSARTGSWPAENAAVNALSALAMGQQVQLGFGATRSDRYGRLLAHLFAGPKGHATWVQGALLARGLSRAYGLPSSADCLPELLAHERAARDAGVGLWAVTPYKPIQAERTGLLMSKRSSFQIVRGTVIAVGRTKGAIYLNFGSDWHSDFSVRIPRQVAASSPDWDKSLESLKGQNIEVRGWIVRNNGPMIEISNPAEITREDGSALAAYTPHTPEQEAPAGNSGSNEIGPQDPAESGNEKRPERKAPGGLDL